MKVNMRIPLGLAIVLVASTVPVSMAAILPSPPFFKCLDLSDNEPDGGTDWINPFGAPDQNCSSPIDNSEEPLGWELHCPHFSPHSHTYGFGGSVGAKSDTATGGDEAGAGVVTVTETNVEDCDGDGSGGDFDGDYETGVGGGFFGYGPWADEPTCNYDLAVHGASVVVNDVVFGSVIAFVTGADDTSGPVVTEDPVDGSTSCSTSGSITPGDPATDPTADADDCLSDVYVGTGTTCGAGGDGGYWVFLNGLLVTEDPSGVGASNAPTTGTITA